MQKPKPTAGLHHVALYVKKFTECAHFYTNLLGMKIMWQPDEDNLYLTSGNDNLALHRAPADFMPAPHQHLDHIGFFLTEKEEVDRWHDYLQANGVTIKAKPKDHRDGTRSFYCADPDGNIVQLIYYVL
ncbi:VOC family protein [Aquicella lusitana]|uniref:Catechol 2,3-dioxygenase-like lactoylglutathione lyase family enzyme n=1 Tax=Aquicella lusitana TaxID=254246 RepID=A0A370GYT9_9COXI|nr:VOC family protein [Aquicella lusitana]RDI48669.1 catechol 2,3-dioxygenase-like lactoylglutathione lyase family enzyme [Aquicella lusitana]VVC73954.1 Metallothiol transferase FosB [Aquicella lusitana]